jgi:pimeloyl-ACP methyl ester carboxylesterase
MKSNFYVISKTRWFLVVFFLLSYSQNGIAQQFLTTVDGWNAYVHLPGEYNDSTTKKYPLICFVPGIGEIGTDASKLLLHGPNRFVSQGHNMEFMVNGKVEKPIVISIQPVTAWPNPWTLQRKLDSIVKRWRCDTTRLNVTGLSMGGWSWQNYVDGYDPRFTNRIASMVVMSAPEPDNTISKMQLYAKAGGKWWGFEGTNDYRKMDMIRDTMNFYVAASARYFLYSGGHCCWNNWYNPTWNQNGESIYTWMLKQRKVPVVPLPNNPPSAFAGNDSSTSAIVPNFNLRGNANDPDGNTISINWVKISGPAGGTLSNTTVLQPVVSGLGFGTYRYELKVVDTLGATGRDTITINNGFVPLPVTLAGITAWRVGEKVQLAWKTETEINSSHFILEKSTNGQLFNPIGTIAAAGFSNAENSYQYTDALPVNGVNYYRLRMVDKDGQFAYSNIVTINLKDLKTLSASINSTLAGKGSIQFNISSNKSQPANLIITDGSGRKYASLTLQLQPGFNRVDKPMTLATGIYYANLRVADNTMTTTFVTQ